MGGGTLIFSYIRRLSPFGGFKILTHYFWGFQKNEYFLKYEDFVDISGYYRKTGLFGGSFLCYFRVFS